MPLIALVGLLIAVAIAGVFVSTHPKSISQRNESLPEGGTAVVHGQAFLKTRGGDVRTAAGNEVVLCPLEYYGIAVNPSCLPENTDITTPIDPIGYGGFENKMRRTLADADGRFIFRGVPAGNFVIVTRVVWEAATRYGLEQQGGYISKHISVKVGDDLDVIVTH